MPVWPETLPQYFQEQGYDETMPDTRIESRLDVGGSRLRARFTSNWVPIQGSLWMTTEQYEQHFLPFWHDDLSRGIGEFVWVNPIRQQAALMRFRAAAPKPRPFGGAGNVALGIALWQLRLIANYRADMDTVTCDSTEPTCDDDTPLY